MGAGLVILGVAAIIGATWVIGGWPWALLAGGVLSLAAGVDEARQ